MVFTVQSLLEEYRQNRPVIQTEKIPFSGVGDKDVYNITATFEDEGEQVIAGRVEGRDTEHSEVMFFTQEGGIWKPRKNTPSYTLQDPFVSFIHGQLVFGGVEIYPHPEKPGFLSWRTVFYKGKNIRSLEPFAVGPNGMKDIRLVELPDRKVGVFTRPQGKMGGRGKIGYTVIDELNQLNAEVVDRAPLIKDHFIDEEWGGVNEVTILSNGLIGTLGHIARYDDRGNRHYYPMVFIYQPETNQITDMQMIAVRDDFPAGPAKRPDVADVLFSGGLVRRQNGKAELYVGVSDAEAHKAIIDDPFLKHER